MSEKLGLQVDLNKNFVDQGKLDTQIKGLIRLWPNQSLFSNIDNVESHIILLLDSSNSMDEELDCGYTKHQVAIDGLTSSLSELTAKDEVSVITYNNKQTEVIAEKISGTKTDDIKDAIEEVRNYSGKNNFVQALQKTKELSNNNTQLIFLTDWQSETINEEAFKIAEDLNQDGISINIIGLGNEFDFGFMKNFSDITNGWIKRIGGETKNQVNRNIKESFIKILRKAQRAIISNVSIALEFPSTVRDVEFYQQAPEKRDYRNQIKEHSDGTQLVGVKIGSLIRGNSKQYMFSLAVDTLQESDKDLLTRMFLEYSIPLHDIKDKREVVEVNLDLNNESSAVAHDSLVEHIYEELQLFRLGEKVEELLDEDEVVKAGFQLRKMINIANDLGNYNQKKKFKDFLKKIEKSGKLSQDELNQIYESSIISSSTGRSGDIPDNFSNPKPTTTKVFSRDSSVTKIHPEQDSTKIFSRAKQSESESKGRQIEKYRESNSKVKEGKEVYSVAVCYQGKKSISQKQKIINNQSIIVGKRSSEFTSPDINLGDLFVKKKNLSLCSPHQLKIFVSREDKIVVKNISRDNNVQVDDDLLRPGDYIDWSSGQKIVIGNEVTLQLRRN